jgi:hypothetical protein
MEIKGLAIDMCCVCRDVYITGGHKRWKKRRRRGLELKIYAIAEQALRDELDPQRRDYRCTVGTAGAL